MKLLTAEQIIGLHSQLIASTGGLDGVRDKGLVESTLATVFEVYFGVEKYVTIEEKAARLCYSLVKNHAFLDGNKRIGIFAMLVFWKLMEFGLSVVMRSWSLLVSALHRQQFRMKGF